MKKTNILLLIILLTGSWITAQVKIGENPQNIDPASVLELESTDKVLVITRVTTAQMNAITPIQGALCYNTELQAVHYFDGTQWVNIGSGGGTGGGGTLTADPIVNPQSTIVITPTANGDNLEVAPNSIRSEQIVDGGVNGVDIQDGSIGPGKLQDNSVTEEKLSENSVGTFALDNANIGVSAFNNDVGYITAANVVSADANNALQIGTDNGAFYDELPLINAIQNNTDAINADGDTNATNEIQSLAISGNDITISGSNTITLPAGTVADGSETIVNGGTNVTVTGDGTAATPYIINAAGGATGTTEEADQITITGIGTNADPFKIEPGTAGQILTTDATGVVWANAATGGGTTEEADQTTITGVGTNADPFKIEPSATDGQVLTTTGGTPVWADLPPSGGSALFDITTISGTGVAGDEYTVADDGISTIKILDANVTPAKVEPSATDGQVLTTTGGATVWADLPPSGANALFDATTISGTGVAGDEYTVADDGISTVKILDANVTPEKIAPAAALTPAADQMLITTDAGIVEWAPLASHFGTPSSVFFADATTGAPVTSTNPEGEESFVWNQAARFGYGQLLVGLDGNTAPPDVSKVVIAETPEPANDVAYPLLIQTSAPAVDNASTGILFSPEKYGPGTLAKGALIYQRTGDWAIGDFHFLQSFTTGETKPTTADKAFTVKNNKDIVIYGGVEVDGDGLGAAGEVLTSTGTGVEWAAAGGGGGTTVNVTAPITGDGDGTPLAIAANGITTALLADDAITTAKILDGEVQTADIADNNVTTAKIAEGADGDVLTTNATGDVVWAAPTAGAVSVDATITGDGNATPLSVANDAITTARILDGEVQTADIADNNVTTAKIAEGADGDVLTTNATGDVVWAAPTAGAVSVDATITGDGNATPLSVANDAITSARILDGEVQTADIADGAITGPKMALSSVQGSFLGTSVIVPNTIGQADIGDNAIGPGEIQSNAVSSDEIDNNSIEAIDINTGAITTDEILNETIINEDIAAGAGIEGTKINPDFGAQNIITTGDVTANSFIAALNTYPDYVFQKYFNGNSEIDPTYKFQTISEIEQFVKQHNHLPGVKSYNEIQENNLQWNITEGALKNLEKIEELFLHTIEQEKKLKALEAENESLKATLKAMQDSIEEIKTLIETKG